jgi:hypothetical protein
MVWIVLCYQFTVTPTLYVTHLKRNNISKYWLITSQFVRYLSNVDINNIKTFNFKYVRYNVNLTRYSEICIYHYAIYRVFIFVLYR